MPQQTSATPQESFELARWKERCRLAEKYIVLCPCDPDITREQHQAYREWQDMVTHFDKLTDPQTPKKPTRKTAKIKSIHHAFEQGMYFWIVGYDNGTSERVETDDIRSGDFLQHSDGHAHPNRISEMETDDWVYKIGEPRKPKIEHMITQTVGIKTKKP